MRVNASVIPGSLTVCLTRITIIHSSRASLLDIWFTLIIQHLLLQCQRPALRHRSLSIWPFKDVMLRLPWLYLRGNVGHCTMEKTNFYFFIWLWKPLRLLAEHHRIANGSAWLSGCRKRAKLLQQFRIRRPNRNWFMLSVGCEGWIVQEESARIKRVVDQNSLGQAHGTHILYYSWASIR